MTYEQSHHRPREEWGEYCQHGKQLTEPDPESPTYAYPTYRYVEPWPCDAEGCTREALEASWDAMEAERFRELEREAYDAVAGSDLSPQRDDTDVDHGYRDTPFYYGTGRE